MRPTWLVKDLQDELRVALELQSISQGTDLEPVVTAVVEEIQLDIRTAEKIRMPTARDYALKN